MHPTVFKLGAIDPYLGKLESIINDSYAIIDNEILFGNVYKYKDSNHLYLLFNNDLYIIKKTYTKEQLLKLLNKRLESEQIKLNKIKSNINSINPVKREKFLLEASLSKDAFLSLVKKRDEEGYDLVCFSEITSAISIYRALFKLKEI